MTDFTNLFTMTKYSFLESVISIDDLITFHKKHNYQYVGLCERNIMYSTPLFLKKIFKNKLTPVLSINFSLYDKNNDQSEVIFIALNYQGYKNLMKVSTLLNDYQKPHIFIEDIIKYVDDKDNALVLNNKSIFLKYDKRDLIYLGISSKIGIKNYQKTIPWHKATFLNNKDNIIYKSAQAIKKNQFLSEQNSETKQLKFNNYHELELIHNPITLKNLSHLLHRINFSIPKIKIDFLKFINAKKDLEIFKKSCWIGLEWRSKNYPEIKKSLNKYHKRLEREINTITKLGWESYFLLVWDVIRFAKSKKILVGPGRGSASGSLVVFVLGITNIDPLKYNLIFERFLNPERVSMPDIDIDFQDNRRQEIIDYVFEKYGIEHVAHIITFQKIGAKTAIRDSGRILKININIINQISKMIITADSLLSNYHNNALLRAQINMSINLKKMFRIAYKIEGFPRQSGLHAAGLVFNSKSLSNFCPTKKNSEKVNVTQYSMNFLEENGLVKVDFLGLKALSTINDINDSGPHLNLNKLPLDNKKVFDLMNNGDTTGIFQLESFGMRKVLTRIQINSFEDIVSAISLYRPGPQDNIEIYAQRKLKTTKTIYLDIRLKPILSYTYGIIIYQEQIIQIAQMVANFSLAKADLLRRAMSKKDVAIMDSLRDQFINNALKNNYSSEIANKIYRLIYKFANYGFNRAHAVAYAVIAYQLAYFKSNYYLYFITNLLTNFLNSKTKLKELMTEAQSRKIAILDLDINKSQLNFIEENGKIRLPLTIIKSVGKVLLAKLINERNNKPFISFFDFITRMYFLKFNEGIFRNFINSGALDCFANRGTLLNSLNNALNYVKLFNNDNLEQTKLLKNKIISEPVLQIMDDNIEKLTESEKKVLGFNWKIHPTINIIKNYKNYTDFQIQLKELRNKLWGIFEINEIKVINTKNNEKMCFMIVSDLLNSYEITVFPKKYQQLRNILKLNLIIECNVKLEEKNKFNNKNRLILVSLNKVY